MVYAHADQLAREVEGTVFDCPGICPNQYCPPGSSYARQSMLWYGKPVQSQQLGKVEQALGGQKSSEEEKRAWHQQLGEVHAHPLAGVGLAVDNSFYHGKESSLKDAPSQHFVDSVLMK